MKFLYIAAFIPALAASFTAPATFSNKVAAPNTVATNSLFTESKVFNPFQLKAKEGDADFEKKKIIVLGGDGFCGWPTSLHLSDAGHDVVIVDNLSRRHIDTELGCSSLTPIQPPEVRIKMLLVLICIPCVYGHLSYWCARIAIIHFNARALVLHVDTRYVENM